ncbi:MAG: hypothetical protein JO108_31585 [Acidobacteriaceae bacterium]|nr:hypothetical protein [Acidobacteriaceae bacterium]
MNGRQEQPPVTEAPLYVRWEQERAPYSIELRFDLVNRIKQELAKAEETGVEIGGVLIGSVVAGPPAALRIDELEFIRRRPEDGPIYTIDPRQHGRFSEVKERARTRNRAALGFFRSHVRPGLIRPSIADRTLLSNEFKGKVYMLLLIEAKQPHWAAFFIATEGELPAEPSAQEFRFDADEFENLPESEPEPAPSLFESWRNWRRASWTTISAILLIGLCACLAIWFLASGDEPRFGKGSGGLALAIDGQNNHLRISWDHAASQFSHSSGAVLNINDGGTVHQVKLGVDELRLGTVDYETAGHRVRVTMTVNTPGSQPRIQSADWP